MSPEGARRTRVAPGPALASTSGGNTMPTILFALLILLAPLAGAEALTLHVGTLLAVPGEPARERQTVRVEDGRIVAVEAGYRDAPAGGRVVDLRDAWVLPGLIDMHVHLLLQLGPEHQRRQLLETPELQLLRGAANARKTVEAGFTTVRDLGGRPRSIFALRDAIAAGLVPGPRVFAAGSALAATGGHGDVDGIRADLMAMWTPSSICDGAVDCRRAAREAVKYGADWIKVTATGGVLSASGTGLGVQMTDGELREIVATAHGLGVKVAAHAHGTDGIDAALRAGVDSIDHGTFLDEGSVVLFRERGAWLVPTLLPGATVAATMADNPFFTADIREKVRQASARSRAGFALALRGGVDIAFGTDTGVTPHGDNAREFALMVDAGMTPAQAIRAATVDAARLLGEADRLGSIETGRLADLIAVDADPLQDVTVLQQVRWVMAGGRVLKGD
jgi:imidazolonepropionase-like amidohydrolase